MDSKMLKMAIEQIAQTRSLSEESVVTAIEEALTKAYIKSLGGGDDAKVNIIFDVEEGFVALAQLKTIVEEDKLTDDYLEISYEDAKEDAKEALETLEGDLEEAKRDEKKEIKRLIALVKEAEKNIRFGGEYPLYESIKETGRLFQNAVKGNLRNLIVEQERIVLYEIYKDHVGEMITGTVEKADDRSVTIMIGKTTIELSRREMIGDEMFKAGDPIKVYIQEVKKVSRDDQKPSKGPQIEVTRSSEGFLKRLFEEEIHEIYDGTVLIKGVAREAGIRSKIAVSSMNEDVDPTGACIGPGGSRIQKIVNQLGNGKDKEKIDIITYSEYPALFIADSLRPAHALGVKIVDELGEPRPKAVAVVEEKELSLAIGKRGSNARLANRLTGWDIEILTEEQAKEDGIEYVSLDEIKKEAEEHKLKKEREIYAERSRLSDLKKKQEALERETDEDVTKDIVSTLVDESMETEEIHDSPIVEEKPIEKKAEPIIEKPLVVKTTTTLEDLEKELASSKDNVKKGKPDFKKKRPHKISDEEVAPVKPIVNEPQTPSSMMPIYSEEELAEIEKEESDEMFDDVLDDIDIDEYDKYYDDEN